MPADIPSTPDSPASLSDSLFEKSDDGSSPAASSQISSCPKTVTFRLNNAVVQQFDLPRSTGSASSSPSQHTDDDDSEIVNCIYF
jgi:hypothetical protein